MGGVETRDVLAAFALALAADQPNDPSFRVGQDTQAFGGRRFTDGKQAKDSLCLINIVDLLIFF